MDRRAGGLRPPCIVWRREPGEICAPLPFDKESLVFFPQILWYVYFAAGRRWMCMVSSGEVLLVGVRSAENGLARAVSGSCPVLALVADADGWLAGS